MTVMHVLSYYILGIIPLKNIYDNNFNYTSSVLIWTELQHLIMLFNHNNNNIIIIIIL